MKNFLLLLFALTSVAGHASEPAPVRREHNLVLAGGAIRYAAAFERFKIASPHRPDAATITTIAYVRQQSDPQRPVLFAFNGGPGASSIFLNVGMLGPQRVELPADPAAPIPRVPLLVANRDSILDVADIVLIDPVGTGFSRLSHPAARGYFYSSRGDAQAVTDAIVAWTRANGRAASPKYVLGESYGAQRAVLVAATMLKVPETSNLAGVVLVSQSLQIVDTVQRRSNIVGQVTGMPTLAVSAWYHKLAGQGRDMAAFVGEAATFARERWLPALMAGSALADKDRREIATGLSYYTGLKPDYFLSHDLYLTKETYRRLALADKGQWLGVYDTRYLGPLDKGDPDAPLTDAIMAGGAAMWRRQFGIDIARDKPTGKEAFQDIGASWNYLAEPFSPTAGISYRQIDYVADLLDVMETQPRLRLMVVGGWFDTAASAGADDYLLSRPGLDRTRVTMARYEAGHMFYTDPPSRSAFAAGLRAFVSGGRN